MRSRLTAAVRRCTRVGGEAITRAIREGLQLLGREHRAPWFVLLVVAVLAGALELTGAATVYLLLALVAEGTGELSLPLVGDVRARFPDVEEATLLLALAAVMGAVFLVRAVAQVGQAHLQSRVGERAGARLSHRLVLGYLQLPYHLSLRRNSADLIRNAHTAVDQLVWFVFLPVVSVTAEAIMIAGMLALLISVAALPTVLAVAVIGAAALLLLRTIQPRLQQLGWTSHELNGQTLKSLQQALQGRRDITLLGREHAFADQYATWRDELGRVRVRHATVSSFPRALIELALVAVVLILFAVAVTSGRTAGDTLSVLGLFAYAGLRIQPSLQRIVASLNNLRFARAPLDALYADFHLIDTHAGADGEVGPVPFEHAWSATRVSLRYEGTDAPVLRDVDLTIRPGEAVGICGPTGGGKTSLLDVMTGLLPPSSGTVTVDGRDLRSHARGWHRQLGVVPQSLFLVDDTIRHNIALGVPHEAIDDDALTEAVALAQLQDFVAALPDGIDTIVGERGVRLSGGERQRVAIARALYRRPAVLVFDEGTAALDTATEASLMAAIDGLRGAHTIVLVAHRLSTVRGCDRVVFVEDGRIAGVDTFDGLVASNVGFRRLAGGD